MDKFMKKKLFYNNISRDFRELIDNLIYVLQRQISTKKTIIITIVDYYCFRI